MTFIFSLVFLLPRYDLSQLPAKYDVSYRCIARFDHIDVPQDPVVYSQATGYDLFQPLLIKHKHIGST